MTSQSPNPRRRRSGHPSIPTAGRLILLLALAGCGRGGSQGPQPTPTIWERVRPDQVLYTDNSGGIRDSMLVVVRTPDSLRTVINRAASMHTAPPELAPIDFSSHMVLLAAMGRNTPNDRVWIDSIGFARELTIDRRLEDVFKIAVRLIEACRRGGIDAFPLQIVRVPRSDATVKWIQTRQRDPACSNP